MVRFDAAHFIAQLVPAGDTTPFLQVGASDAGLQHYLLFQRTQPVGGDADWGLYVEVDDQVHAGYDKVAECELTAARLTVRLVSSLGLGPEAPDGVEINFANCRPSRAFVNALRAAFAGRETLLHISEEYAAS
jgi:hypothetical protein